MTDPRWEALCDKLARGGYSTLRPAEKVWINIRELIDSVENGGVISYFYNPGADTLRDCIDALTQLGADDIRAQLDRVCALFGDGVPASLEARNGVIDSWKDDGDVDSLLEAVDRDLMPMLPALEAKLDAFVRSSCG